jgi:FkbM family methyltransferase
VAVKGFVTLSNVLADFSFDFSFPCPAAGVRWSARAFPDKLTRHLLFEGTYQHDVVLALHHLLQPGDTVFDVGAHHGLMSVIAGLRVGATGRVIGFEPNPAVRRFIPENLALNGVDNVRIEPIGLGATEAELDFYQQTGSRSYNSSFIREFVDPAFEIEPIKVRVTTVDAYVARTGVVPNLIKIDTEGTDMAIIEGSVRTIERHRPVLLTEFNRTSSTRAGASPQAMVNLLQSLGYTLRVLRPSRLRKLAYDFSDQVPFEPDRHLGAIAVTNVICLPPRERACAPRST